MEYAVYDSLGKYHGGGNDIYAAEQQAEELNIGFMETWGNHPEKPYAFVVEVETK